MINKQTNDEETDDKQVNMINKQRSKQTKYEQKTNKQMTNKANLWRPCMRHTVSRLPVCAHAATTRDGRYMRAHGPQCLIGVIYMSQESGLLRPYARAFYTRVGGSDRPHFALRRLTLDPTALVSAGGLKSSDPHEANIRRACSNAILTSVRYTCRR